MDFSGSYQHYNKHSTNGGSDAAYRDGFYDRTIESCCWVKFHLRGLSSNQLDQGLVISQLIISY